MKDYQLRALLRIVETGSIRAAARALQLSQPAVTKAIRELEAGLDAKLVVRTSRGVELTEAGRRLVTRARLAEEQLELAVQDIRLLQGGRLARVTAALTPMIFLSVLPDVIRDFRHTMPYAQLKLYEGLTPAVLPLLREGFVDFAVAMAIESMLESDIEIEPMGSIEMMVCCRRGHPLAGATQWRELVDAEWIVQMAPGSHHSFLFDHLRANGLPVPSRVIETTSFGVSWSLLTRSDALSVIPSRFLQIEPFASQVMQLPIAMAMPHLTLGIMKLRAAPLSLAASRLAALFKRHAR